MSDDIVLKFGSVFRHKEKDYVYLTHTEETLYSALVLNSELSDRLKKRCEEIVKTKSSPKTSELLSRPSYFFVELRTEEFKERVAHLYNTDQNPIDACLSLSPIEKLIKEDLNRIKEEIINGPTPLELKEKLKKIEVE